MQAHGIGLQEEYTTRSGLCEGHDQISRITRKKANEESPHHEFGKLGMIDATTGKITELKVPTTLGNPEDLHSIAVANGNIWFTSSGANALVRYSPDDSTYTFFHLPVPGSVPFGLALASTDALWFTAGGNPVNYVGEMTIPS